MNPYASAPTGYPGQPNDTTPLVYHQPFAQGVNGPVDYGMDTSVAVGQPVESTLDLEQNWYHGLGDHAEYPNGCARGYVVLLSFLLLIVAIGVAIVTIFEQHVSVLPACPHCAIIIDILGAVSAFFFLLAVWGFVAACRRTKCMSYCLAGMLLFVGVGVTAIGFAATVAYTSYSHFDDDIHAAWTSAVSDDPAAICAIQSELHCSGYSVCCNPDECFGTDNQQYSNCAASCSTNDQYTNSCDAAIESQIHKWAMAALATAFSFAFLLFVGTCSTVRMSFRS
jgi:hypothetical protein